MAPVTVSLTIPEGDAARVKTALMRFTELPGTATPKELAAATIKKIVRDQEKVAEMSVALEKTYTEPSIT